MKETDKLGVVDSSLRVYGIQALKVADLIVAPDNIGAHNTANIA
jgi:alcohol oxidase